MTVATVKVVAQKFLTSPEPGVLAIKGPWGVGKTFAWNQILDEHATQLKLQKYSYVSLFGLNSITQLRVAIFSKSKKIGSSTGNQSNANSGFFGWLGTRGKGEILSHASLLKEFSAVKGVAVGFETLAPYFIRDSVICLDDFERLNPESIKPDELLGLISELKEERNCKVVLIFNEDRLEAKETYKKYREKVVDIELQYSPTLKEVADIAFAQDLPANELVRKYCVELEIRNIRILRKIAEFTRMVHSQLRLLHPKVMEQAVMTLVLLVWSYYEPDENKPNFEFITKWNRLAWGVSAAAGNVQSEQELKWSKILQKYGLLHIDEFDLAIRNCVERGYLEESGLAEEALKVDAQYRAENLQAEFTAAWNLFHNTFDENRVELVEALSTSLRRSVRYVSPINLQGTIGLLRQLGEGNLANDLIDFYIEARADQPEIYDLNESPFGEEIKDEVIREKFKQKFKNMHPDIPLLEAVNQILSEEGWSHAHIASLNRADENDFYALFKANHGSRLNAIIKACLRFEDIEGQGSIATKVRAALLRIANESPLNAIRVRRYGVAVAPPPELQVVPAAGPQAPA